ARAADAGGVRLDARHRGGAVGDVHAAPAVAALVGRAVGVDRAPGPGDAPAVDASVARVTARVARAPAAEHAAAPLAALPRRALEVAPAALVQDTEAVLAPRAVGAVGVARAEADRAVLPRRHPRVEADASVPVGIDPERRARAAR